MSLRINHNLASINGQRNLMRNDQAVGKSLERLSSGLKINKASDNAAGLVISEQMRAQISGLTQAVDNSETAVAMVQTAEGALDEMNNLLTKMRELTLHAANAGTNDSSQVLADQKELDNAVDSISRIANTTQFGTKKLIDGSLAGANNYDTTKIHHFDVGSDLMARADFKASTAEVCITTSGTKTSMVLSIGNYTGGDMHVPGATLASFLAGSTSAAVFCAGGQTVSTDIFFLDDTFRLAEGASLTATVMGKEYTFASGESAGDILSQLNQAQDDYTFSKGAVLWTDFGPNVKRNKLGVGGSPADFSLRFSNGVKSSPTAAATAGVVTNRLDVQESCMARGVQTVARITGANLGGAATTINLVADTTDASILKASGYGISIDTANSFAGATGSCTVNLNKGALFQIGANASQQTAVDIKSVQAFSLGLGGDTRTSGRIENLASLKSRQSLVKADFKGSLQVIDKAIDDVTGMRGQLGAFQANTLETGLNSLRVTSENLTAAESTIRDVDFAGESAAFTKNNILMQASNSMLAQANQLPQGVLSLLGR